jgi:hypothetical protein
VEHLKPEEVRGTAGGMGGEDIGAGGCNALYLKVGTVLDFESKSSYAVAVTDDDPTLGGTPDAISTTYTLNVSNVSGVTITGTNSADVIDATHTVAGQPVVLASRRYIAVSVPPPPSRLSAPPSPNVVAAVAGDYVSQCVACAVDRRRPGQRQIFDRTDGASDQ